MSLTLPLRLARRARRARRAWPFLLALAMTATLVSCKGSSFWPDISSTPVATPIVVNNSPSNSTPTPPPRPNPRANEIRRQTIDAIISKAREAYPGHSGVVFVDLDNETRLDYEPDARFESASLVKLIILAHLYREFEVGHHSPDEKLVLLEKQKVGGSGHLKDEKEGSQHTLQSLAEAMITESDNTATQMLTDLLGRDKIAQTAKTLGLNSTTFERDIYDFAAIDAGNDNYITPRDAATFLCQLARQELPGSQGMHEILERQKRNDMIGKDFPATVRVAHKTGELEGILHDAAIVYAPRGGFVLVALSDRVSDKEAAKKVWAEMALDILRVYSEPSPSPTPDSPARPASGPEDASSSASSEASATSSPVASP
jgi:beta-lactamase class A